MAGNEQAQMAILSVEFPRHLVSPQYNGQQPLSETEIEWALGWNFEGVRLNKDWDKVTVNLYLTLQKKNREVIVQLQSDSAFKVTPRLSYATKFIIINRIVNEAIGHLIGGWVAKNTNHSIRNILPQPFHHLLDDEPTLRKKLYDQWE